MQHELDTVSGLKKKSGGEGEREMERERERLKLGEYVSREKLEVSTGLCEYD